MSKTFGTYLAEGSRPEKQFAYARLWAAADRGGRRVCIREVDAAFLDPDVGAQRWRAFEARVLLQEQAHRAGGKESRWAGVWEPTRTDAGWWCVQDRLYAASGRDLARREGPAADGASLRAVTGGVLLGLSQVREACGRGHGNIKPSNILLDRLPRAGAPVRRAVLTDPDPFSAAEEADDLAALGVALYEIITKREYPGAGGLVLTPGSPESQALGSAAGVWAGFCSDLLERRVQTVGEALARIPKPARRRTPLVWAGAVAAALGVAAIALWAAWPEQTGEGNPNCIRLDELDNRLRPLAEVLLADGPWEPSEEVGDGLDGVRGGFRSLYEDLRTETDLKGEAGRYQPKKGEFPRWVRLLVCSDNNNRWERKATQKNSVREEAWESRAQEVIAAVQERIVSPVLGVVERDSAWLGDHGQRCPGLRARLAAPLALESALRSDESGGKAEAPWGAWVEALPLLRAMQRLAAAEEKARDLGLAEGAAPYLAGMCEALDATLAVGVAPDQFLKDAQAVAGAVEDIGSADAVDFSELHRDEPGLLDGGVTAEDLTRWASRVGQYRRLAPQDDPRDADAWSAVLEDLGRRVSEARSDDKLKHEREQGLCSRAQASIEAVREAIGSDAARPWIAKHEEAVRSAAGKRKEDLLALESGVKEIERLRDFAGVVASKRKTPVPSLADTNEGNGPLAEAWTAWLDDLCAAWEARTVRGPDDFSVFYREFDDFETAVEQMAAGLGIAGIPAAFRDAGVPRRQEFLAARVKPLGRAEVSAARADELVREWRSSVVDVLARAEPAYEALERAVDEVAEVDGSDIGAVDKAMGAAGVAAPAGAASVLKAASAAAEAANETRVDALLAVMRGDDTAPVASAAAWGRFCALATGGVAGAVPEETERARDAFLSEASDLRAKVRSAIEAHLGADGERARAVTQRLDPLNETWERLTRASRGRAEVESAFDAASTLGISFEGVEDRVVRANWRLWELGRRARQTGDPVPEINSVLADLETLDGEAGEPAGRVRERIIKEVRDKAGTVEFDACGPAGAAAGFPGWTAAAEPNDDGVVYQHPALGGQGLRFVRVLEGDKTWSYVGEREVSIAVFKAVTEACADGERLLALLKTSDPSDGEWLAWEVAAGPPPRMRVRADYRIAEHVHGDLLPGPDLATLEQYPMTGVGAGVAACFCSILGCRPPTAEEWVAALARNLGTDPRGVATEDMVRREAANVRDSRSAARQVNHEKDGRANNRSRHDPRAAAVGYPQEQIASGDHAEYEAVWLTEDDYAHFAPVGEGGGHPFLALLGNAMELVVSPEAAEAWPSPEALGAEARNWKPTLRPKQRFLPGVFARSPEALMAIGGSAWSGPRYSGGPWPLLTAMPLRPKSVDFPYADLGMRLAFSVKRPEPKSRSEYLADAFAEQARDWYVILPGR